MTFKKGQTGFNKGKRFSEETRKKMSESAKKKIFTKEHRKHLGDNQF